MIRPPELPGSDGKVLEDSRKTCTTPELRSPSAIQAMEPVGSTQGRQQPRGGAPRGKLHHNTNGDHS